MAALLLTVFGAFLGFVLSLIFQPLLQQRVNRWLSRIPFVIRRKKSIAGSWVQTWHVESDTYPAENPSEVMLRQVGGNVVGKFKARGRTYQIAGTVEQLYFTGNWRDTEAGHTYDGVFQLRILPNADEMKGKWVGWTTNGSIQANDWTWKRAI